MVERLLIIVGIVSFMGIFITAGGVVQRQKARKEAGKFHQDGSRKTPTVLYFWSDSCAPCEFVQSPTLDALESEGKELEVVRINAIDDPKRASQWGVMTVPTTILLDKEGQPTHINNRAVKLPELKRQLGELGVTFS